MLAGCASTPYADLRINYQHDGGSDWVLQPEREWIDDRLFGMAVQLGTEWDNQFQCYLDTTIKGGPFDQVLVGCSKRFGKKWYIEPAVYRATFKRTARE